MSGPLLSVVIPTYNEAANVGPLLRALREALAGVPYEAVVVDDASKDATAANARAEGARVIVRTTERGLATAVVRGLREAGGTYIAVMDADFQHPPASVRALLDKAVAEQADVVIGSRYAPGGSEGNFGPIRRTISWGAALLGKVALPPIRKFGVTDPMSGLFLVRRAAVDPDALRPHGYKILLEILGRCPVERVVEVGYTFQDRREGESKLGAGVMVQYVRHIAQLGWDHPENRRAASFALVGLSGVLVNLGLLWLLHGRMGLTDLLAVPIAVEASIISNFLLNDRFTFHDRRHDHVLQRLAKFNAVSLLALAINYAAYIVFNEGLGLHYLLAEALAIGVAFGANYVGNLHWTYGGAEGFRLRDAMRKAAPWLPFLLLAGAASFVYLDEIDRVDEIYFDEHYYVTVARQIDNGIWEDPCWIGDQQLDHRPLNYEHPPLAKLLMAWSVMRLDSDHAVFEGCRSPDDQNASSCNLVQHGEVLSTHDSRKACYDAYTSRAKEHGNPVAWRLPSALLGVATVVFIALAAHRLFGTVFAGMLAGTLVLLDTLVYTSARMAILDIFAAGFLAGAVYAATFPSRRGVFWTAAFLGLAFGSKYSVVFAGPAVALLSLWTQRRAGVLTRRRFDLNAALFVLVPLAIWLALYIPWWRLWIPDMGVVGAFQHWMHVQGAAFKWGAAGYQVHAYSSQPIDWIAMERPTFYYHVWNLTPDGQVDASQPQGWVYAVGNPLLWWTVSAAVVCAIVAPAIGWVREAIAAARGRLVTGAPALPTRPVLVTAAGIVGLVRGVVGIGSALVLGVLMAWAAPYLPAAVGSAATLLFVAILALAVLVVVASVQLLRGREWARRALLWLSLLGIVVALLTGNLLGVALDIVLLVVMLLPSTQAWIDEVAKSPGRSLGLGPLRYFREQPLDVQAVVLTALLAGSTYGFFFLVDRVTFLFYMTLIVPLGCLALAGVLHLLWQRTWGDRAVVALVVVGILASALFYLPVASGERIPVEQFERIMDAVPWMRE